MQKRFPGEQMDFVREGRLCGLLNHRNVMDTYEFGVHSDQAFIAMEFIDGVTLNTLCKLGPLPPALSWRWGSASVEGWPMRTDSRG